ncbi:hypothetical protein PENSUB_1801 [Penicillium subrubescens]|uniref:Uncharacterized protein n=1 Tax=Penicillium subrubescens TaxID=1316194 RepID=A0A1Q5UJD3_9EURO|nr:hypothetical protein PENSUB_1801 [Penicillium subrubescens]
MSWYALWERNELAALTDPDQAFGSNTGTYMKYPEAHLRLLWYDMQKRDFGELCEYQNT